MDSNQRVHKILMLPWLAHGHVSPFLELAKRLIHRNFQVYICSTPVNLNPIREKYAADKQFDLIKFIDIDLPPTHELPPDYHTTKNLPPYLMPVLKTAFDGAKENFRETLRILKPDLVIYDFLQPWAPVIADEERIPAVLFLPYGAATVACLVHFTENPDLEYPVPEFNFPKSKQQKMIGFIYHESSSGLTDKERFQTCIEKSSNFILIKKLNEIERSHIDYFSLVTKKEVVPVGPLVQEPENKFSDDSVFVKWLSKRDPLSAVFVSFGSEYFLSKEEIATIASGLELSKVSFIWVVRFHGEENINLCEVLPEEFQERVAERGMVVEGWAPQAKILSHPSIGGFVSHCGWSSTMESITFGVPIIAMPMQLDQPINARLIADNGLGLEVPSENDKFRKEEIARVIREVVLQEEGKEVRKKVKEFSDMIREKGDQEIDHAANKLLHLVNES